MEHGIRWLIGVQHEEGRESCAEDGRGRTIRRTKLGVLSGWSKIVIIQAAEAVPAGR